MKHNNVLKISVLAAILIYVGAFFTACSEDVNIGNIDEGNYATSTDVLGYIVNGDGKQSQATVEFRDAGSTDLFLGLSKDAQQDATAEFKLDQAVLDSYNAANESNFELFPADLVSFDNNGSVTLKVGEKKSTSATVKFRTGQSLQSGTTYAIPVRASVKSGGIKLSDKESAFLILVRDNSKIPDAAKASGIKIISCMEINDTNPLNNLCFTLKDSGKPLIDIVILFSANINYNGETGKVFVSQNPNVAHLLANKDKYLKPLQARGIKVVLGILGNHDRAGVANLSDNVAREFAQELKDMCDAYNLDGIFFDDEYSKPLFPAPPGFVNESNNAAARLCYETKKAMPDRLVCAYVYRKTASFPNPVDGVQAGDFVDYGIHDYGGSSDLSGNYPGMPRSGMAIYSQEFNLSSSWASEASLKRLRDEGYGAHMIFAMDPNRENFLTPAGYWWLEMLSQKQAMERLAKVLYDDELVYDGKPYRKDW